MNAELRRLRAQDRLGSVDVHLAETLARRGRESRSDVALAAALASRAVSDGHVCLDLARACGEAGGPGPALESWHASLQASAIVDDGTDGAPLVHEAGRLYLRRYWEAEQLLARALRARALAPDLSHDPALLERDLQRVFGADARSARQRAAARVAARRPLCVISGGPGTGKTAIVVRVLALLVAQATAAGLAAPRIALLAPTGKAARRLEQAVATGGTALDPDLMRGVPRQAMTLHRALGARPGGGFRHARQRPLTADVVVVDEASMVDLPLMAQLVDAVRGDARLILLGDRDQLASVEAGAVLSDICGPSEHDGSGDGLAASIVTLKEVFRYASGGRIARLSEAINAGDADAALALLEDASDASVTRIEPGAAALTERAVHGYLPYLRAAQDADAVAAFRRFRVLCAHQQGPSGARETSRAIEQALSRRGALRPEAGLFYQHRPLAISRNDPAQELYNGDVALIRVDASGRPRAVIDAGDEQLPRTVSTARLPAHETAFALSIHKSQGSQFDEVAIVLPTRASPLLTRELLYTAVTRASERLSLHATAQAIRTAIQTRTHRASGLRDKLWSPGRS